MAYNSGAPARKARQWSTMGNKTSNLMQEIWAVTSASASVRTYSGGGGVRSKDNPTQGGECHLFLAGNRAVLLGNQRFSWREFA